jgi:hypothetical protein
MGAETEATNPYAFASGYYSNADGNFSTAMGFNTDASGLSSTALGTNTAAEQAHTFAVGHTAEAQAIYAIAMGNRTIAQSYNSMAIGSYNIGGGSPNEWLNSDPIFEIGIGQSTNSRHNALTVLKNGRHGILTNSPKASLHVKDDGVIGSGTIVAVLESKVSDRPILQFSETANGDKDSGMSIEYDGSGTGSNNKMYINDTDGLPTVTFESGGQVGIGIINPTFALHLPNNTSKGLARAFSWSTYSDKRIKSNEKPLSYGLNEIMMLKPLSYRQHGASIKASKLEVDTNSTKSIGFFAQEVYQIIPEAVVKPKDPNEQLWGMEYEKLIPVLVKAIQEQQLEILKLKEEVKKLSN